MAMVGDRDMPAWQCIRTLPPDFRAPSVKTNERDRDQYNIMITVMARDSITVKGGGCGGGGGGGGGDVGGGEGQIWCGT